MAGRRAGRDPGAGEGADPAVMWGGPPPHLQLWPAPPRPFLLLRPLPRPSPSLPLPPPRSPSFIHMFLPSGPVSVPAAPSSPINLPSCLLFVMRTFFHPWLPTTSVLKSHLQTWPSGPSITPPQLVLLTLTHLSHPRPSLRLKDECSPSSPCLHCHRSLQCLLPPLKACLRRPLPRPPPDPSASSQFSFPPPPWCRICLALMGPLNMTLLRPDPQHPVSRHLMYKSAMYLGIE